MIRRLPYTWLALLTGLYLLLLALGTWMARGALPVGPLDLTASTDTPLVLMLYTVSLPVVQDLPLDFDEHWLEAHGISTPLGGDFRTDITQSVWGVVNTMANHQKLQTWLTATYGAEHWRHTNTPTYKCTFQVGGRKFGLEQCRQALLEKPSYNTFEHKNYSYLFYGYNNQGNTFLDWEQKLFVASQYLVHRGPVWASLLLLVFGPGMLLYFLRLPLRRAILRARSRFQTESSPAAPES